MAVPDVLGIGTIIVTGLVYAFVGYTVARRRTSGDAMLAGSAFALWWFAIAGSMLLGAARIALFELGAQGLPVHVALTHVTLLAIVAAFWGLMYYLVYIFTGSRRWLWPTIAYWAVLYVGLVYLVVALHPVGVEHKASSVTLIYASQMTRPASLLLGVAFVVPILASAIAYARLWFTVEDPTQKYRIGLVSGSLATWFIFLLVGIVVPVGGEALNAQPWWSLVSRLSGLAAALVVLMAYRPPRWIRERYGIQRMLERADEAQ